MSVAVFNSTQIQGSVVAEATEEGTVLRAEITKLPPGKHGFHIHKAGDLRGEGCKGACEHWHKGPGKGVHGGRPRPGAVRHTGDLGNIELKHGSAVARYTYFLEGVKPSELLGRAMIIHEDEDDLGRGQHEDSKVTGHSGARIGCAIFGRIDYSM